MHANQRPVALQLFAVQFELELAGAIAFARVAERLPGAAVPHDDGARAVLLGRDHAFEFAVLQRVVLDMDGHSLVVWIEARSLRHSPAFQRTVELEPEVIVQPARGMLLDHIAERAAGLRSLALGLGRRREVALFPVSMQQIDHVVDSEQSGFPSSRWIAM